MAEGSANALAFGVTLLGFTLVLCMYAPCAPRYREVYDLIIETLRLKTDDTFPIPAWLAKMAFAPRVSGYTALLRSKILGAAGIVRPWGLTMVVNSPGSQSHNLWQSEPAHPAFNVCAACQRVPQPASAADEALVIYTLPLVPSLVHHLIPQHNTRRSLRTLLLTPDFPTPCPTSNLAGQHVPHPANAVADA